MRLFVALALPADIRETLALMRGSMPGVQWVPAENHHIGLRFIGEITERHRLEEIDLALSRLTWKPFELSLAQADIREGLNADSLLITVERTPQLDALQAQIERILRRAGCAPARRRFQPAVTLGHFSAGQRGDAIQWVQSHNLFRSKPMFVDHVTLFESLRSLGQHVYVPRAEYAWQPEIPLTPEEE
ncbi:RNA 2',3'-cyclic phosphodiesterase [Gluconobacter kanchanaburiensis]|uniref:RNA 2',3'-cyclic phosphodiesterase n=1 Tax=Gluconobacter kanchanaburiensis NBRC 103587 TaxID=1307948 RepID=A0A511B3U6_9PROT|nr:RNA 2',3'-cyclic phosphodiesterase [Gluconobacter kanchanaburiensis]MBF0860708.1 RNA 2',3'-cyclic phosphodiesterase [Gluconobacter kanchanaburiensis]GBR69643.1 2'-5' RNA ligase [Gluconobacter kanchanaburiensis NBRC 103587]GEK95115.1 RNA 2',3'-cyclic phosphodiesterase [Gluconobacter kanchanaburiensis NBRC 103587]